MITAVPPDFGALAEMAAEREDGGATIEALYHGACRGCGGSWSPGDAITYSEGESGWICVDCAGL